MTGQAGEKPKRETWRDWQDRAAPAPRPLLTQAELLALLAGHEELHPTITKDDLRYWQGRGILPAPVRQWHDGATRAVYPLWYGTLVADLRLLTKTGLRLAELPPILRAAARQLSRRPEPELPAPGAPPALPRSPFWEFFPLAPLPPPPDLLEHLTEVVKLLALPHALGGVGIPRAVIGLFDAHGRVIPYELPLNLPAFDPHAYEGAAPAPPASEEGTPE